MTDSLFSCLRRPLRCLGQSLGEIDRDYLRPGADARRAAICLVTLGISLFLLHYLKFASVWVSVQRWLVEQGLVSAGTLRSAALGPLLPELWWGLWHVIAYVVIPVFVIRVVYRERVRDFGLRAGGLSAHWPGYLLLATPILLFVVVASYREDFLHTYPFYGLAGRSVIDLLAWEMIYLAQFVCLEFFFRGFVLQSLAPSMGSNAIWVMCVPYLMIHFAKPWPEAAGALLFGLFLGILALRARSIWGGVLVHVSIALSMDIAALLQGGGLPRQWWP